MMKAQGLGIIRVLISSIKEFFSDEKTPQNTPSHKSNQNLSNQMDYNQVKVRLYKEGKNEQH